MSFHDDFKKYHANRSDYPCIKADSIAQEWSVYIFGKPKKFFKTLKDAKAWYEKNKWDI